MMDTMKTILSRKSVRSYTGKRISETDLSAILKAANAAPVGMGKYETMHLTVIEDQALLTNIDTTTANTFGRPEWHPLYGAPTLIVVSTNTGTDDNTSCSNAAVMVHNMIMAATELGVGCCHIWGAVGVLRQSPELLKRLNLPSGFSPSCGIILGATEEQYTLRDIPENRVAINYVK